MIDLLSSVLPIILDETTHPFGDSSNEHQPISATVTAAAERLRTQSYLAESPLTRAEVEDLLRSSHPFMNYDVRLRHFPRIAPSVRPSDISLPMRAGNCLLR